MRWSSIRETTFYHIIVIIFIIFIVTIFIVFIILQPFGTTTRYKRRGARRLEIKSDGNNKLCHCRAQMANLIGVKSILSNCLHNNMLENERIWNSLHDHLRFEINVRKLFGWRKKCGRLRFFAVKTYCLLFPRIKHIIIVFIHNIIISNAVNGTSETKHSVYHQQSFWIIWHFEWMNIFP